MCNYVQCMYICCDARKIQVQCSLKHASGMQLKRVRALFCQSQRNADDVCFDWYEIKSLSLSLLRRHALGEDLTLTELPAISGALETPGA